MRCHRLFSLAALLAVLTAGQACAAHRAGGIGLSPQEEELVETVAGATVCLATGTCTLVSPKIDPRVRGPALHLPLPRRVPSSRTAPGTQWSHGNRGVHLPRRR